MYYVDHFRLFQLSRSGKKKALGMEAEPCKVQEEKGEEEMEEAVRDERNMLVMEEEEKDERGAGRDAPLTILIPNSPSPPRETGGLNNTHPLIVFECITVLPLTCYFPFLFTFFK